MKQVNRFSISDISAITGIKSATLRIWEQRYQIIHAKRSASNIRYYDDFDLRIFLNISSLINSGLKISEIAAMSDAQRVEKIQTLSSHQLNTPIVIQELIDQTLSLNERLFKNTIQNCINELGVMETMLQCVYPFLNRVGLLWQTGLIAPAQEHFATSLIKQRLIVAIDDLAIPNSVQENKFILFLPEGEFHEIALLLAQYIVRAKGFQSLYLGQNLPIPYVQEVVASYGPSYIITVLTNDLGEDILANLMQDMAGRFPTSTILVAGSAVTTHSPKPIKNCVPLCAIDELYAFITENVKE
jgi:DNA-binding transcriptional MerR regulator